LATEIPQAPRARLGIREQTGAGPGADHALAIQEFTITNPGLGLTCFFEVVNIQSAVNQQWGRDNSRITVIYKIAWANRFVARALLLGMTTRQTAAVPAHVPAVVPYLSRNPLPHQWIEAESQNLYCTAITNTEGLVPITQPFCYEEALITCNYEQLPFDVRSDASITVDFPDEAGLERWVEFGDRHSTGRLIKAYGLGAVFCNEPGAALPNPALAAGAADPRRPVMNGQLYPIYEDTIPYVWHQVPLEFAPLSVAADMQNKMNSITFDGYPPRTLLYMGYRLVRTRLPQTWDGFFPDTTRAVNIQYEMKYQRNGWDKMPDPIQMMRWYPVRMSRDLAKTMLEEDDFANLFRPL
jgi:hypothetical protein